MISDIGRRHFCVPRSVFRKLVTVECLDGYLPLAALLCMRRRPLILSGEPVKCLKGAGWIYSRQQPSGLICSFSKSEKRCKVQSVETVPCPILEVTMNLLFTLSCRGPRNFGGLLWIMYLFVYLDAHRCTWQPEVKLGCHSLVIFHPVFEDSVSCWGLYLIHQARLTGLYTFVHTTVHKYIHKYMIHN